VEFNEQIYRAPSIPKISRRNISSSVMRGAQSGSGPKLRKSTFSFIRPKITPAALKAETSQVETLAETNRILVEIQNQLALDFATRITERQQALRASKIRVTRERAAKEESALESVRSFGSGIFKAFDKVAAPAKSIFQRILDFFSIIVTGLIVNNAFKWLEKKENREKLKEFFNFVKDYWKEILITFGVYKILKLLGTIKRIVDIFKRPPKPPGGGKPGGGPGGGPGPGPGGGCGPVLGCIKNIVGAAAEKLAETLKKTRVFSPLFGLIPRQKPVQQPVQQPGQKPQGKPWWQTAWNIADIALDIATIVGIIALLIPAIPGDEPLVVPLFGRLAAKYGIKTTVRQGARRGSTEVVRQGAKNPIKKRVGTEDEIVKQIKEKLASRGGRTNANTLEELAYINEITVDQLLKSVGKTLVGRSQGGTIGGRGPGNVDSVPAMLAPGEEVIRTSAANLFRPLLKDINNNAGRMWNTFSTAIRDMVTYNQTTRSALNNLNNSLQVFKKQLDDFVNKERLDKFKKPKGGGYGLRSPQASSPTLVLPTLIVHSDLKKPTRPVTRTTIPITLPTKTANYKMPPIDGGMATDEPDVSSVNLANDYMMLTPRMYGIFV